MKGIDISSYQGDIDFTAVMEDGVQFAIMKIIKKSMKPDSRFEENWSRATSASCPVQGVYNYSYATTTSKGAVNGITGNVDLNILYDETATAEITYTVRPGDTLSRIARAYNTTVSHLVQVNAIKNPDKIYPGQILKI
jgi:GH25 family lysozyme M1 (1,4-beta-N-acetylmuramidase)